MASEPNISFDRLQFGTPLLTLSFRFEDGRAVPPLTRHRVASMLR